MNKTGDGIALFVKHGHSEFPRLGKPKRWINIRIADYNGNFVDFLKEYSILI